jgi:hypothetical protein
MKVGSNPTATTPTANFEVEATNGQKVIVEKATSKVGIGITSPSTKLHIAGALTTQIETVGTFNDILHATGGAAWGFGDASRIISWGYNVAGGTGGDGLFLFVPGNFRQSTSLSEATISMFNDNSGSANHKVGIATINPTTTLDVNGTTKTTNLQVTTGAGAGKVLTSDAAGLATWQTPAAAKPVMFIPTTPFNSANVTAGNWSKLTNGRTGYKAQLGIFSFTLANASDVMASAVINGGIPCAGCPDDNGVVTPNLAVRGSTYFVIRKADNTIMGTSLAGTSVIQRDAAGSSATATPLSLSVNTLPAGTYYIDVYYTVIGGLAPWTLLPAGNDFVYSPTSMNIQILALTN